MRHSNANRKFGRKRNQRKALLKSLAVSLVNAESITTSEPKAKEIRPMVEKLITTAKKGTLASYRTLIAALGQKPAKKLFTVIAPKYSDRKGGYTRITKLVARKGDGSARAIIEFV